MKLLSSCLFIILFYTMFAHALTLRVGISENEPLVYRDQNGKFSGVFVDLLETVAQQEGWELDYVYADWNDLVSMLQTAKIDILPDIAYTEEREKLFDFNKEVIFTNWGRVFTTPSFLPQSLFDLRNKRVAVMKGDVYFVGKDGFQELNNRFDLRCTFIEVADYKDVFTLLAQGKADAGVVNRIFGEFNQRSFSVQKTSIIFKPVNLHYGFPKNAPLNKLIIPQLDKRLSDMKQKENSLYYQFIDNYFVEVKVVKKIPRGLLEIMIGILILTLLAHSIVLKYRVKRKTVELQIANDELNRLAVTDLLTNCYNRRFFMEELLREIMRSRRYTTPLSLVIFDIDHFKLVNDTYGHLTGDMVLTRIGTIIRALTRENDCAARYGGEEFVLLLPETTCEKAAFAADKLRKTLENELFSFGENNFTISASFGVCEYDGSTVNNFISHSDEALYKAKENRGSIVIRTVDNNGNTLFTTFKQ